jgi:peptide/nickel transport system substrate-binding protein
MKKLKSAGAVAVALGTALAMTLGTAPGAFAQTDTTFAYAAGWNTVGIINPVGNNNVVQTGIAYAPLALYKYTGLYDYWPDLAKTWSVTDHGNQVTVHLNPNAKWSNGTPVTAHDVYVTFEVQFIFQNPQSWGLTGMKVLNPETIVFYKNPHYLYNQQQLLFQILNETIYPAADYQQFIPKNLWKVVLAASNPNTKAKSTEAAVAELSKWTTEIQGYNFKTPSALIYDGPWSFSRWNSSKQLYVKNPYYVFAKNITADNILAINQTTNDVSWRALQNGQISYAAVSITPPAYKAIMSVHDNHFVAAPQSTGMSIMLDEHTYPFNLVQVRQALAYMINRHAARMIGEPIGSVAVKIPDGMTAPENQQWLTPSQLKTLNPYSYNPAKAAKLLESVGFKKTSAGWMTAKGQPFTVAIHVPQFSDWDAGVEAIVSKLKSLGVNAEADVTDTNTFYSTDGAGSGKWPVDTRWWGGWNPIPVNTYNQVFIDDNQFEITNTGGLQVVPGGNPLNVPTTLKVPGVGNVQPMELTAKLWGTLTVPQEKKIIYKLAKMYNYWLPAIPVWNQEAGRTYSTQDWTWPDFMKSQALLNQFTYQSPFVVYQVLGLMKPKQ